MIGALVFRLQLSFLISIQAIKQRRQFTQTSVSAKIIRKGQASYTAQNLQDAAGPVELKMPQHQIWKSFLHQSQTASRLDMLPGKSAFAESSPSKALERTLSPDWHCLSFEPGLKGLKGI